MGKRAPRDTSLPNQFSCAVCGIETNRHADWFLLAENRWLDRLRILAWHPVLATQEHILGVCCRQHLKTLITHWLNVGNLELQAERERVVPIASEDREHAAQDLPAVGWLVGELSVQRETFSRTWTGSVETLECILKALLKDVEPRSPDINFSVFDVYSEYYREIAVH